MKKVICLFGAIALIMSMALLSCGDGAGDGDNPGGGGGGDDGGGGGGGGGGDVELEGWSLVPDYDWFTGGEPFEISTPEELAGLAQLVNAGEGYDFQGLNIIQTDNLYLGGRLWTPIGLNSRRFKGTYNGNGKTISGLTITSSADSQGLFGYIDAIGTVKGVKLQGLSVSGGTSVGALAGRNYGTVQNCSVTGSVIGGSEVGGIVGRNEGGTVERCSAAGSVTGSGSSVGGIAGTSYISGSSVKNCYATSTVKTTAVHGSVGGIVGVQGANCSVQYCYVTGSVQGYFASGIIGTNSGNITNSAALNTSVSGESNQSNRVTTSNGGTCTNNYGRSDMLVNGATKSSNDLGSLYGRDVDAALYNTQTWWTSAGNWNTAAWDFGAVWAWDGTANLPVLK